MSNVTEERCAASSEGSQVEQQFSHKSTSGSTIKLVVGPGEQTFEIREGLICSRCPFFFNAFSGSFLEAQTKVLTFPDDDPERFKELQAWLDNGTTPNPQRSWIALCKIWLFADKYHIDHLQNLVIDALHSKFAAHEEGINISFETLDFVAENTFSRSPLRRLFADMLTNGISLQQLPSRMESIPYVEFG